MVETIRCEWPDCNEIKPHYFPQFKGWLKSLVVLHNLARIEWFCPAHKEAAIKLRCNRCGIIHLDFPMNPKNKAMCSKHERSYCAMCLYGRENNKCLVHGCMKNMSTEVYMDAFHRIWRDLIINDVAHWNDVRSAANEKSQDFVKIRIGDKDWMAENFSINTKDSWFYDDKESNNSFGQLYSPIAAKKACPDGWRLPSKTDWEELITHFGGKEVAGKNLMKGGASGFNATLAGRRYNYDGSFIGLHEFGAYWCEDELEDNGGWAVSFRKDRDSIEFFSTSVVCFSVRYIKA